MRFQDQLGIERSKFESSLDTLAFCLHTLRILDPKTIPSMTGLTDVFARLVHSGRATFFYIKRRFILARPEFWETAGGAIHRFRFPIPKIIIIVSEVVDPDRSCVRHFFNECRKNFSSGKKFVRLNRKTEKPRIWFKPIFRSLDFFSAADDFFTEKNRLMSKIIFGFK